MQFQERLDKEAVQFLEEDFYSKFPYLRTRPPTREDQSLTDRIRRSLSWLNRATQVSNNDTPPRFVEFWIGLNALYGCRPYDKDTKPNERRDFEHFLRRLKSLDRSANELTDLMKRIERRTQGLINNKYLWNEFWRGDQSNQKREAEAKQKEAQNAASENDVVTFFTCCFERLLILRNQILHGSCSENTKNNVDALKPALLVIEEILPVFLRLMIHHGSGEDWPPIPYPAKGTPQHSR